MKEVTALVAVCIGLPFSVGAADPVKVVPPQNKVLQSNDPNQRYVFGQISEYRRDQFMLDTRTGRLWQIVVRKPKKKEGETSSPEEGFAILDPVPYTGLLDNELSATPR